MDFESIMSKDTTELLKWLIANFTVEMPSKADEVQGTAPQMLLKLTAYHSYLTTLLSFARIKVRHAKRNLPKPEYEDMVDKKEIIQNFIDRVKQEYTCISREMSLVIAESKMSE